MSPAQCDIHDIGDKHKIPEIRFGSENPDEARARIMNVGTIRGKLLKVVVITVVCDVTSDVLDQTRHRSWGEEGGDN